MRCLASLSLLALRPIKETKSDKPRNAIDYFMKIELRYKCAGLDKEGTCRTCDKLMPAVNVIHRTHNYFCTKQCECYAVL